MLCPMEPQSWVDAILKLAEAPAIRQALVQNAQLKIAAL
jgi:hypothetical protein